MGYFAAILFFNLNMHVSIYLVLGLYRFDWPLPVFHQGLQIKHSLLDLTCGLKMLSSTYSNSWMKFSQKMVLMCLHLLEISHHKILWPCLIVLHRKMNHSLLLMPRSLHCTSSGGICSALYSGILQKACFFPLLLLS